MKSVLRVVVATLMCLTCHLAGAQQTPVAELISEFSGQGAAKERSATQWEADYALVLKALAPRLGASDVGSRREPAESLERMCMHAARPGAETQRASLARVLATCLGADVATDARVLILRQLENIGRAEVVQAIESLLNDPDMQLRVRAICALENNPTNEAAASLRAALDAEKSPQWQVALINAVGFRADAASLPALRTMLRATHADVACAAAGALGKIGTSEAADALQQIGDHQDPAVRAAVVDAYLLCATKLAAAGNRAAAQQMFKRVFTSKEPRHCILGAMRGLALCSPEDQAAELIVKGLESGDAEMAATAGRLVVEMPGSAAAVAVGGKLAAMTTEAKVIALRALADRADAGAASAVIEAAASTDAAVRLAAIEALGKVGGDTAVRVLAEAAGGARQESAAARQSLASLRGPNVDATILAAIPQAQGKARNELVRSLAARRAALAVPMLLGLAVNDADATVRVEAINAIGALGDDNHLARLVAILAKPQTDADGKAAESAVTAIISRMPDPEKRAEPLLAQLANASGAPRVALVRVLGRTGSSRALALLRQLVADPDPDIQLAAVRALSDWPTADVATDLLSAAKNAQRENLKVLALRGYVRVVGLPSTRTHSQTAKMLEEAMNLARVEDKRLVLSGLANVPSIDALKLVEPCLDQTPLAAEAQTAAVAIGSAIAGSHGPEVVAMMRKVVAATKDTGIAQQARDIMRKINGSEGFITDFVVSGPYAQADKSEREIFDIAFPPETGQGTWKPMKKPGGVEMDFSSTGLAGDNRCAYLRTSVWSPKAQEVQFECGSDDGIKVWLNGKVVHANNANRGSAIGQDAVRVQLKEGWNVLLLKVTNGGGGWSCNARLCQLDGTKVPDLKVKAE